MADFHSGSPIIRITYYKGSEADGATGKLTGRPVHLPAVLIIDRIFCGTRRPRGRPSPSRLR